MNFKSLKIMLNDKDIIELTDSSFITIIGNSNLINNFINKKNILLNDKNITKENVFNFNQILSLASITFFDIFLAETVKDTLAFGLESNYKKRTYINEQISIISDHFKLNDILEMPPKLLTISQKAKLIIASFMITNPKILIIDDLLELLDFDDYKIVISLLKDYKNKGNIVINITNNIEQTLCGNYIYVLKDNNIILKGKTIDVLNEEKVMKRLGYDLPFIIKLNRYLKDYALINDVYMTYEELIDKLWK